MKPRPLTLNFVQVQSSSYWEKQFSFRVCEPPFCHVSRSILLIDKMAILIGFIDIRFADPVVSLSMTPDYLAYGTAMGRLLFYNIMTCREKVISETSEEGIYGLWVNYDSNIFAAVGDYKAVIVLNPEHTNHQVQTIQYDRVHTEEICAVTQVMQFEDNVALLVLNKPDTSMPSILSDEVNKRLFIVNLSTQIRNSSDRVEFGPHSAPLDYDGQRLIWIEFRSNNIEALMLYRFTDPGSAIEVMTTVGYDDHICFAKLYGDNVLVAQGNRHIRAYDLSGKFKRQIGSHKYDIVAMNLTVKTISGSSVCALITVDYNGTICIWNDTMLLETIYISQLDELTPKYKKILYFSMGYPYYVCLRDQFIGLSTDHGVLVIKSVANHLIWNTSPLTVEEI